MENLGSTWQGRKPESVPRCRLLDPEQEEPKELIAWPEGALQFSGCFAYIVIPFQLDKDVRVTAVTTQISKRRG